MTKSKMFQDINSSSAAGSTILLTLAASLIYGISSGVRANYGILLGPISQNSGVNYASVSFVLAIAQLSFGVMQPIFGVLSMKKSSPFVLRCGVGLMSAGVLFLPFCKSLWTLLVVLGFLLPSGTAALSFGIVMGVLTPKLPRQAVSGASGIVTASSGIGSTIFSPLIQTLTAAIGLLGTMMFLSVPSILLLPVSLFLCRARADAVPVVKEQKPAGLITLILEAAKSRDYCFLLTGFFTCGFHMAIIETHLYTQITTCGFDQQIAAYAFSIYGIATLVGCLISGVLCGHFSMRSVLCVIYGSRTIMVLAFLLLPKNLVTIFGFAILLGLTGNATVPPTSGLTEQLFGPAKLAALFGAVFFSHQIGSFFSAWLGGICLTVTGGYTVIWLADIAFSGMAAVVSLKIQKEN